VNYLKNPRFNPAEAKLLIKAERTQKKEVNIKSERVAPDPIEKVQVSWCTERLCKGYIKVRRRAGIG